MSKLGVVGCGFVWLVLVCPPYQIISVSVHAAQPDSQKRQSPLMQAFQGQRGGQLKPQPVLQIVWSPLDKMEPSVVLTTHCHIPVPSLPCAVHVVLRVKDLLQLETSVTDLVISFSYELFKPTVAPPISNSKPSSKEAAIVAFQVEVASCPVSKTVPTVYSNSWVSVAVILAQ